MKVLFRIINVSIEIDTRSRWMERSIGSILFSFIPIYHFKAPSKLKVFDYLLESHVGKYGRFAVR